MPSRAVKAGCERRYRVRLARARLVPRCQIEVTGWCSVVGPSAARTDTGLSGVLGGVGLRRRDSFRRIRLIIIPHIPQGLKRFRAPLPLELPDEVAALLALNSPGNLQCPRR